MSNNFKKIFNELIAISFETPDYIDEINFSSIKQSLCFTVATCLTSKSSLKKEIDIFFDSWLNSFEEHALTYSCKAKTEIYESLDFEEALFIKRCSTRATDSSTNYQGLFRNCIRDLYPKITEAAQNIKERIEMPASQIESTQVVREAKKSVKWADRFPSTKSSSSSLVP